MLLLSFDNDGGKRQIEEGLLCAPTVTQTDRLRLYLGPGAGADRRRLPNGVVALFRGQVGRRVRVSGGYLDGPGSKPEAKHSGCG